MKIFPIKTGCCSKSIIHTTNDGNRTQYCSNCNFHWEAPKENRVLPNNSYSKYLKK